MNGMTDSEVLREIWGLTLAAKTIEGRLRMRDEIKRLLDPIFQEGAA